MGPYSSIAGLIQSLLQGKKQTDPIANYEQDFGMGGGSLNNIGAGPDIRQGPDIPNYRQPHSLYPDQMGIVPQEYLRASQRRGYVPDINPYDFTGIPGGGQSDQSIESPDAAKIMPNAVQRQDGMGLNNIAGRHGSFPLTEPPFGASGTLDTALPGMGYDYTNEGYTDFTPMGHDYTNEGYANWSTPQNAVSSGTTFAERDMLASAGENRDLLGIGQPVGSPPVDPREIAIKKRFGQNIGNVWGDARLRERMQDLYGGSF